MIRFQLGDKPPDIPNQLSTAERVPVSLRTIQILCKSIREGTFTPVKTPTPGRPRMTTSEANVRHVKDILEVNPREILGSLSLPKSTVNRILKAH